MSHPPVLEKPRIRLAFWMVFWARFSQWWSQEASRFNNDILAGLLFDDAEIKVRVAQSDDPKKASLDCAYMAKGSGRLAIDVPFSRSDLFDTLALQGIDVGRISLGIEVPEAIVYRRSITIPSVLKTGMSGFISDEFKRYTPFSDENAIIYTERCNHFEDASKSLLKQVIIKRVSIRDACEALGLHVGDIDFLCVAPIAPDKRDIENAAETVVPVRFQNSAKARIKRRMVAFMLAGTLLLASMNLALSGFYGEKQIASLNTQIISESVRVDRVRRLDERLTAADANYQALDVARGMPRITQILNDMAQVIPDASWLTDIEISAEHIKLSGYSSNSAPLISLLSSLPFITEVRFDAPVTSLSGGSVEHFSIRCVLTSSIPKLDAFHG